MSTTELSTKPKKAQRKSKNKDTASTDAVSSNGASSPARKKKRAELTEQLRFELRELRTTLDELVEHYRLRVGGQIAELEQALIGPTVAPGAQVPSVKLTDHILKQLQERPIKSKKGRAKDFVRLQKLVKELGELLPPEN